MILKITIDVKDKIEAFSIVSKLGFKHNVIYSEFENKKYEFDNKKEETSTKRFLSEKFKKEKITNV